MQVADLAQLRQAECHIMPCVGLSASADGALLATGGNDATVTGAVSMSAFMHVFAASGVVAPGVCSVATQYIRSATSRRMGMQLQDQCLCDAVWDTATSSMLHCIYRPDSHCNHVSFSSDGSLLAYSGASDTGRLVSLDIAENLRSAATPPTIHRCVCLMSRRQARYQNFRLCMRLRAIAWCK